ncbi:MAG: carbon starvation protein A [Phycisphaerales bacterium]|nr:carbon starvation protein A [Phycisphaerales bacterium]
MNIVLLIGSAAVVYYLAQRFYAPFLSRQFGEDDSRPTPAVTCDDGVDFVPTRPHVLFAHHFSAIAAAGPILGPTMALLYGYVPAMIWIVVGAVLIGAVHDYSCLFVSMREGGRSIAEVARRTLGNRAFALFALFICFNLIVVNAVFLNLTAVSLTSLRDPAAIGLPDDQTLFRTIPGADGRPQAVVGGIASTSAIALTVVAPILGLLVIRRKAKNALIYPLATALCIGSVLIGFVYPVTPPTIDLGFVTIGPTQFWVLMIAVYVWVAAALPVWMILQPREFVSVQFLYGGIALLVCAIIGAAIQGAPVSAPATAIESGEHALGSIWPILFVTIACGAVSGFHGLVASGTTSKQIALESHARPIGYVGMLGESALALCVTFAIAIGVSYSDYSALLVRPVDAAADWKANPVLAFSVGVAGVCEIGLGIPKWLGILFGLLMVEGFVLDTLDVSIRLNRYLIEEVWATVFRRPPRWMRNFWFNSGIAVVLMLAMAYQNTAQSLWPIFGSGNQLLAALSLFTIWLWLRARGRRALYILLPAIGVGVTTVGSLVYLLVTRYWPAGNYLLVATDVAFLALAGGALVAGWSGGRKTRSERYEA